MTTQIVRVGEEAPISHVLAAKIMLIVFLIAMPFFILINAHAEDTENFVQTAAAAGNFEIESSKLALEKTSNPQVREFAKQMIHDHNAAANNLRQAVISSGRSSSIVKSELDEKHHKILKELQKADTDDFDEDYIDAQLKAHEEAVKLFGDYSKNGDDKTIKAFASKTLPTLEAHLEHVKGIENKM